VAIVALLAIIVGAASASWSPTPP